MAGGAAVDHGNLTGQLVAEAGVLAGDIINAFLSRGWFLPVTPGTKFVTLGGAIAADVHGKNHHRRGSFGDHVLAFDLLRSDGSHRRCSVPQQHGSSRSASLRIRHSRRLDAPPR